MPLDTKNSSTLLPDHTRRHRRPRNQATSPSDPKPKTHSFIQSSTRKPTISSLFRTTFSDTNTNTNNNGSDASKLLKKTKNKKEKFTLRGLGCASSSPPVTVPAVIRSSADWEAKKVRKKKQRTKKSHQAMTSMNGPNTPVVVVVDVPDVCCAPGIAFASDATLVDCVESTRPVASRGRVYGERTNHRERSCTARRTTNHEHVSILDSPTAFDTTRSGSEISNARQYRHFRHRSPGGLPEIMMFQSSLLFGGSLDGYDQFGNWRLDVDNMSYEELLDLGDRIGYVGTGLREDEISRCLRKIKHSILDSLPLLFPTDVGWKCSICQEGYEADDEVGKLDCGHCYHIYCIKQWLLKKNACPVCKAAAAADK